MSSPRATTASPRDTGPVQDLYDTGIAAPTGPPSEAPSTPGPVIGATKVTELSHLQSATIGPDNTVYASIDDATGAPQLIAFDPVSAAVKQQAPMHVETDVHFAAGSVWAAGQSADANGQGCTVTRYDPNTLAKQGDYPIPCSAGYNAPRLTSMGDSVWFVSSDGTSLVQIDPTTNAPGKSVPLGYSGGCCQGSQGAIFCSCGNSDVWRLTGSDSAFVDLGNYNTIFPAGTGFWTQASGGAAYVDGPGGPTVTLAFADPQHESSIQGGDTTGVYVQGEPPDTPLGRLASDGSALVEIANAPVAGKDTINEITYDYGTGDFPWFATARGYVHLWELKDPVDQKDALWEQWAPLP